MSDASDTIVREFENARVEWTDDVETCFGEPVKILSNGWVVLGNGAHYPPHEVEVVYP